MEKIAFLFPGQGAQYPGMGKALYDSEKEIFDAAEKIRPGIVGMCFSGTADDLKKTENTQPCLYMTELAAADGSSSSSDTATATVLVDTRAHCTDIVTDCAALEALVRETLTTDCLHALTDPTPL